MLIEQDFLFGDSVIHRLDPRARIIVAAVFSIVVATSDRFAALVPAMMVAVCFIFVAGLPLKKVSLRLLMVNGLMLLLWLSVPFTFDGAPLFSVGPLTATREGVLYATILTIKSNAIIMALMALVATMPVFTLGRALGYLRVPDKIVHLLSFAYRYIHVIHREYGRLMSAIRIRGFSPGNNIHTYKTYAYVVGMLLLKSHERAQRVRAALLCRGFRGKFYDLSEFSFRTSDWVIMVFLILITIGIGILQWTRIID